MCVQVLRLKGGDPYVFGRGGEEMLYLQQRGIKVHCIPGAASLTIVFVLHVCLWTKRLLWTNPTCRVDSALAFV